ncbi:MAG: hypothetical protein IPL84_04850 [Chitinophagaceae bacterium]|nr:hypothetical protein [Chitinophagaceae bacterium]
MKYKKLKKVIDSNRDDKVAIKELDSILGHHINLLNHYVLDNLYADNGNIVWYFQGNKLRIPNRQKFNQQLSKICETVYPSTPVYRNELVNKTKISGQVAMARKRLLEKIFSELHEPNLGFTTMEFPPEKSIYLTLLRETGMHKITEGVGILKQPNDSSFNDLWNAGVKFLESTRNKERSLSELVNLLSIKPFKLKQGFIDYWIPIFLLSKSDEYALFEDNTYIPELNSDVLDLLNKRPGMFSIKAFDVVGIKLELFNRYRVFLNQAENHKPTNKLFIQTIKPFLVFFRDLPEYAKNTNRLEKKQLLYVK